MEKVEESVEHVKMEELLNPEVISLLKHMVLEHKNILVVGDKGIGKTALLKWLYKQIPENEKVLLFDFYGEIDKDSRKGSRYVVGYHPDCDIVGDRTKLDASEDMVKRGLLLPFDRVIGDELYARELDMVLQTLYKGRSGIFSISFDTPLNAMKHIYLKTMYPENKHLNPKQAKQAAEQFTYVITLKSNRLSIEKLFLHGDILSFLELY